MNKFRLVIAFFALSVCSGSFSQGQGVLSLEECVNIALEHNYGLRIVRNQEEILKNNNTLGNAGYLPVLDAAVGYDGELVNTDSESSGGQKTSHNGVYNDGFDAGLDLNWTIFNGFKIKATREKLELLQKQGELQTIIAVENLVGDIISEYNNLIYQNLKLKSLKYSIDLSQERVRVVEARYQTGASSNLELQQAKVDLNTDNYNYLKQQEKVIASRIALNKLLATDNSADLYAPVNLADTAIVLHKIDSLNVMLEKLYEYNTELKLAANEIGVLEKERIAVRSQNLPYLKFKAGYGYNQRRYEVSNTKKSETLGLNYGLTLGMNLFNGLNTKRELRNAQLSIENSKLEAESKLLNLKEAFFNLYLLYENNEKILNMEKENLVVSKEYFERSMDKYKLGALSGIELREAQQNLLNAESRYLTAEYEIKLCEVSLRLLCGEFSELFN
jgi:outer membrane protein TolC